MKHMRMTPHQPAAPDDSARAAHVLASLRAALALYQDYHRALADGYKIFLPKIPQPVYHFTNRAIAMYIAGKNATPDALNARLPLSVAAWHAHTN
jgi:hypothetical protein